MSALLGLKANQTLTKPHEARVLQWLNDAQQKHSAKTMESDWAQVTTALDEYRQRLPLQRGQFKDQEIFSQGCCLLEKAACSREWGWVLGLHLL